MKTRKLKELCRLRNTVSRQNDLKRVAVIDAAIKLYLLGKTLAAESFLHKAGLSLASEGRFGSRVELGQVTPAHHRGGRCELNTEWM